jgi:hypothetical protein
MKKVQAASEKIGINTKIQNGVAILNFGINLSTHKSVTTLL